MGAKRGWDRREFLRTAIGAATATSLSGFLPLRAQQLPRGQKAVVVTFGGGARDEETFAPEGQENIPHMLSELIPQSTFFTQVINHGILGHYVATASLATGAYETFNNFAQTPPDNPTVFEYFRKDLKRPAHDAWIVAPSNGFNRIGASDRRGFGPELGAEVLLPKQLLAAAMGGKSGNDYEHLLRDNYESPLYTSAVGGGSGSHDAEIEKVADILKLSVDDFTSHARSLASPDELSVFIARQLMRQLSPSLLWITLHDIDIAHSGAYSLYLDGIRRSDRLCSDIWKAIETDPEYKGKTTMFILPDFGRDSDISPGGNGFQHHRTGDALSRTTWMMVLGPGVRQNAVVDRPVDSLDLVPTLGSLLGFSPTYAKGSPLREVL
ncbi:hypothetical protein HDF16_003130 [Granulicella aggregans]|uniref:Uncharacterized protein n=1 Tax=Granulicella aggregans TaxID=474949 RepID=A0A7W7ZEI8_9BACT|nr:hypothetical protein [Granulicella aggregans]MBB5058416.1 hypothetical protein [Granulicella aggregans]